MAPLFCCSLQMCLKQALADNHQNYQSVVKLSPQALEDLLWWKLHLTSWNRRSLITQTLSMTITSDVSLLGWGATSNGVRTRGPWSPTELSPHQLPRATGGHSCSPDIRKGEIRDFNTYASGQLHSCCLFQQKGWTVSPMLSQLTKDLWLWCMKRNILLQA